MAPMTCGILQKSEPISVDMVWYLPAEEVAAWYDFTNWVFWIFGVFQVDLRNLLSVLLHGGIQGRYIRLMIHYCIVCILLLCKDHGVFMGNVFCMQHRKGSRSGRSWARCLKSGTCRWWGYELHRRFLQRDAFVVYLSLIMALGSKHPPKSQIQVNSSVKNWTGKLESRLASRSVFWGLGHSAATVSS